VGFVIEAGALRAALKAQVDAVDAATRYATAQGAHLIERETKKTLTTYTHKKGEPTPSPPGSPPALVTGQLRRSIKVEGPQRVGPGLYRARIGPTAVYGRIQELGGRAGRGGLTRLPARPFLASTVRELLRNGRLNDVYKAAWNKARGVG
jgi:phage gpG-like protein